MTIDYLAEAKDLFPYTQRMRRDFHAHPEIGFQEYRTSGIVANELRELGIEITTGVAETGVIGIIEGNGPGPVLLLRFDMDALPITEETNAPYQSENPGVMHACGHDGHTAVGLTVAKLLNRYKDVWKGTVKLVFQPAEEGLGGAKRMVEEGVLENPRPDYSLAMHVWNDIPVGEIAVTPGPVMAHADLMTIKITGKGAHGASPHLGKDPILAAAQVVNAAQSIVARNVDPMETAVVSITSIHGGTTFNVIPPMVEMQGTIRTFKPEVREIVLRRLREVVNEVAAGMDCTAEIELQDVSPAVVNDAKLTELVKSTLTEVLPEAHYLPGLKTMGSEDMAFLMDDVPGCFIFIGSMNEEKGYYYGHHHPKFDIDEEALLHGVTLITASAMNLLNGG
ncbi:MAG TPA: M20 family metallopeptidase [Anaerolineales bacterium]|nr:M20 family metallopeptidase [Anaerolineales bacterium]